MAALQMKLRHSRLFGGWTTKITVLCICSTVLCILKAIQTTQAAIVAALIGAMPDHHQTFLIGFERGEPD